MRRIHLVGEDWRSPPVVVGLGFARRLRGLRPSPGNRALLLRARSVHGLGMREPLRMVVLDDRGRVESVRLLPPGRVLRTGRKWVLELPAGHPAPSPGTRLTLVCSSGQSATA